ncbi:MAG: SDR family oxidoreductase [Deltaproteobacteria bacterium]|nr:SDR family oxidoreductase [Deltaproteobacteria bacterium]
MKIDLKDHIILLTGATSGIGQAVARLLSKAGATMAMHYWENEKKAKSIQDSVKNGSHLFQADLADLGQTAHLFQKVIAMYGRIDTLINNAGIFFCSPMEKDVTPWLADWHRTLSINLTSAALLCKLSIPVFKKHGGGRIINIASRAAFRGDTDEYLAYAASKGGLVSLTRSIARAYGKENIKAFIVAPGFVRTRMAESFIKTHGEKSIMDELALSKMTEPDDVAPTVVFLASGMMDHATGGTIDINAGSYVR